MVTLVVYQSVSTMKNSYQLCITKMLWFLKDMKWHIKAKWYQKRSTNTFLFFRLKMERDTVNYWAPSFKKLEADETSINFLSEINSELFLRWTKNTSKYASHWYQWSFFLTYDRSIDRSVHECIYPNSTRRMYRMEIDWTQTNTIVWGG